MLRIVLTSDIVFNMNNKEFIEKFFAARKEIRELEKIWELS